jgi:hypothetical protein
MLVRDVLRITGADVVSVSPDQTMAEVVRLFRERNIGFVLGRRSSHEFWAPCPSATAATPSHSMAPWRRRCRSPRS